MRVVRGRLGLPTRVVLIAALLAACGGPGGRGRAPALRQPSDSPGRTDGCIDTPFIGGDEQATPSGIQCGRADSGEVVLLRGRVVGEALSGLPGAGLEGLWVGLHNLGDGAVNLAALPPPMAETKTGPQGSFTLPAGIAGERMIAVRLKPDGRLLAAQRLSATEAGEITLFVPLDDELRSELELR